MIRDIGKIEKAILESRLGADTDVKFNSDSSNALLLTISLTEQEQAKYEQLFKAASMHAHLYETTGVPFNEQLNQTDYEGELGFFQVFAVAGQIKYDIGAKVPDDDIVKVVIAAAEFLHQPTK